MAVYRRTDEEESILKSPYVGYLVPEDCRIYS